MKHLRANALSYVAIFVALSGTAYAGATINSADVVDDSLKSADFKDTEGAKGKDVPDNSLTGDDIDEGTLEDVPNADLIHGGFEPGDFVRPSTVAGGDVTGKFSNLQLAAEVITSSVVRDHTIKREDLSNSGGGAFGKVSSGGNLSRSNHVSSVSHPSTGVYCIDAVSGIDPDDRGLVAIPDFSADSTTSDETNGGEGSTTAEWNSQVNDYGHCPSDTFEVDTFRQGLDDDGVYDVAHQNEPFSFMIR